MSMLLRIVPIIAIVFMSFSVGMAADVQMPGKKDRCPVCGMFVAPYPDWIATITFQTEPQLYFDGCKDMLRYYFKHVDRTERALDVTGIYVTDYYSTRLVPAKDAFFVVGSDVYGPMGKELIPVAGREQAEIFSRDHGGSGIYPFAEITPELLPVD